jgi:hypothetical protein
MEIETLLPDLLDPWDDTRARKLFLPSNKNERAKDSIAQCIDLLMEVCTETEGYKKVVLGVDPYDNCTEYDKFKINDQCIYLISALTIALKDYPTKACHQCCKDASNTCSVITTSCSGRAIEEWRKG